MTAPSVRRLQAPHPSWRPEWPRGCVVLGETRSGKSIFIPADMRALGVHVIGLPGQGKSRVAEAMLRQDLLELDGIPRGALLIDPHGTLYRNFLRWYVSHGLHRVRPIRVLDPSDPRHVFHLNPLRRRPGVDPAVVAAAVTNAVLKVWGGADATATPQLRTTLKHTFFTLCELGLPLTEAASLLDLTDATGLRARAATAVSHPVVQQFWRELDVLRLPQREERVGSTMRRLTEFLMPARVSTIFSEANRALDWREVMDNGEIVIINLAYDSGHLSEDEAKVIGVMMLAEIFLACQGRPEGALPFYIYLDECHRFLTEDIAKVITEGRKFGVHAVLMHQLIANLREAGDFVFNAVMACRSKIVFGGLEPDDAEHMARSVFRGQFDLQRDKEKFRTPIVVGQELDWLLSESESQSTAEASGTNWSKSSSRADHKSRTKARSITDSVSDTYSSGVTHASGISYGVSHTRSSARTRSAAVTRGTGDTNSTAATQSSAATRSSTHTSQRSAATSSGVAFSSDAGTSASKAQPYDKYGNRIGGPVRTAGSSGGRGVTRSGGSSSQSGSADSFGEAQTSGSATTIGQSRTTNVAHTEGAATTEGQAHTTSVTKSISMASTEGRAHTTGTALSESIADTFGTTDSVSRSEGGNSTTTESEQSTRGRSQTIRSVLEVRPQQSYTLEELVHLASVTIGNLKQGEAIVKIGRRPSARITTVRVADGWARPEHIARVTGELAYATPYITLLASPPDQGDRPQRARLRVVPTDGPADEKPPTPPNDVEDEWG